MAKKFKTNALRMLDKAKIPYSIKEYEYDEEHLDGRHVASQVDMDPNAIFKTLVLHDHHNEHLVCCVPVLEEIDLKKLAKLAGRKSVEMIHQKDLLSVMGYIRGGCSPVGMKKQFPTYIDESILKVDEVAFSAGKRGYQMIVNVQQILTYLNVEVGDIIRK
ncbi:Cys-tRNA(Pro) deacylase [Faecalibacillus faecis]|uniref:Cys-tRNA(Pro)/Cys-tRNA(Cys) deacylase n=1 Tax=Faecalibacillus faecis TaxID=1982628 RepID=A0AAW4VU54_9FIRM|nr:Cys-tRNA(Pro) deacylase [Faecalibacillus faecis]MCB8569166.1 Cys-tRNA(Pro) deacylase [Faecalibacillus faecis]MCB8611207.1 Cys-tRNA(Pro) deacylase [Faecalibacillus faecis]MCQ5200313.1 Cys-tRNA(Pro) deacylase [Faecalibacillus faecis]